MKLDDIPTHEIMAQYTVTWTHWIDLTESEPRTRVRIRRNVPAQRVIVTRDGKVHCGSAVVQDEAPYDHVPGWEKEDEEAQDALF